MAHDEERGGEIELRASTPDGRVYSISSYTGAGVAGPAFVAADPDSPQLAHSLAGLVNRGLRLLPRKPKTEPFTVLYVLDGEGHQVCMIWAQTRPDAEEKAHQLVRVIEEGSFDPRNYES